MICPVLLLATYRFHIMNQHKAWLSHNLEHLPNGNAVVPLTWCLTLMGSYGNILYWIRKLSSPEGIYALWLYWNDTYYCRSVYMCDIDCWHAFGFAYIWILWLSLPYRPILFVPLILFNEFNVASVIFSNERIHAFNKQCLCLLHHTVWIRIKMKKKTYPYIEIKYQTA